MLLGALDLAGNRDSPIDLGGSGGGIEPEDLVVGAELVLTASVTTKIWFVRQS